MIITIANEKGGSGKSTLCLNLCVQLLLDKKDIAALDTDSQKSLEVFNNIRSETSLPNFTLFNRTGNNSVWRYFHSGISYVRQNLEKLAWLYWVSGLEDRESDTSLGGINVKVFVVLVLALVILAPLLH